MRHCKRPIKRQKIFIKSMKLNPENWLVVREDDKKLVIMHKETGNIRELEKA